MLSLRPTRVWLFLLATLAWLASGSALATLTTVTPAVAPASVAGNTNSTLTITITTNAPGNPSNISFNYTYPANVINGSAASNTCGGTSTAAIGGNTLSLSGGSLTGNGSCTVTVSIKSCNAATYTIGGFAVTSTNGNPTAGSTNLTVTTSTPTIAASSTVSASSASVAADGASSATITVTALNACGGPSVGRTVSLTQGAGGSVISPASAVTDSSGVATFTVTNTNVQSVTYTAATTEPVTITQTAAVNFTRISAPTVAKSFSPTAVALNTDSTLTVTLTNPNSAGRIVGLAFTDTYPGALVNGSTASTTCTGGTASAVVGGNTLTLSGGQLNAGASCTVTVSVRSPSSGSFNNSTGAVTSTNANNGTAASATLRVNAPPTVAKSFSPTAIGINGTSLLTITITNPNSAAINGVALSDTYPANLVNSGSASTTCVGGTATTPTAGSLALSGGSIAANSSCTVTVNVTSATAGSYTNSTGAVTTTDAGSGTSASATLRVNAAPTVSKSFNPTAVGLNTDSTLTVTITNPNSVAISGVAFTDNYPANVVNAPTPGLTNSCGGAATGNAGASSLSLAGGSIAANSSCSVTVKVRSGTVGSYNNSTGAVTTTDAGSGTSASATLRVNAAPTVAKSFNATSVALNTNSTLTITITNPNSVAINGVAFTDTYPANLVNGPTPGVTNSCNGTASATGGSNTLTLTGGSINANSSCTVTVSVRSGTAGSYNNSTGAVTTTDAGSGTAASATLVVNSAPTVAKAFSPTAVGTGVSSTLTITLTNANSVAITGVAFTDTYPANLVNSTPSGLSNTCGGTATGNAGAGSLSLSGGTIPANGSCVVSVSVQSSVAANYNNSTGAVTTANAGNGSSASATLRVNARPTVAKSFNLSAVGVNVASTLTITITNPNSVAINGVAFTDTYPANLINATPTNLANTCGGTPGATAGGNTLTLSSGTVAANSSCTVTVSVQSGTVGSYLNSTGSVTTTDAGTGTSASATLTVNSAPGVAKSFSPASVQSNVASTLTITLTNANATPTTGVAFTDSYPANLVNSATPNLTNSCGGTASAAGGGGTLTLSGGTIPASGSCAVSVSVQSAVPAGYLNSTGTIATTNAGNGGPATATLTVVAVANFNVVDTGNAVNGVIKTKIAAQGFAVDILALDSTPAVATGFTGTVQVELVNNAGGGACNTLPQIQLLANQTFLAGDNGRHALAGVVESNAYPNLKFRVTYAGPPAIVACSTDAFANRPADFVVQVRDASRTTAGTTNSLNSTANPGSGVVHNAGRPFQIDVTARNNSGATTGNYAGTPDTATLSPCGVAAVCPATPGALSAGTWSVSGGTVTTTTASYNDVGSFNLSFEDHTFSSVDNADSTTAERYILSAPVTVGRFVPDFFSVSAASITPRTDIAACSASSFTYMGERMDLVYTLKAQAYDGSAGGVTRVTPSYTGATLGALALNSAGSWNFGAIDGAAPTPLTARLDTSLVASMGATWSNGSAAISAPLAVSRAASPDGPYGTLKIGIAPSDPDGVTLVWTGAVAGNPLDLDADNSGTPERKQIGAATAVRFGRVRLTNASASERLDLAIPIEVQYWNGSAFVRNSNPNGDSCTSLATGDFSLGTRTGGITAGNLPNGNIVWGGSFASGVGSLRLTKPTPSPASPGTAVLTLDLAGASRTYLQGNWGGAAYTFNPSARAAFGFYGAQPKNFIFFRENY